ncbi:hypothetical protein V9T40_004118 [Parthenolecanium corni]|uniref:Methyltransferase-like protein 5 n=1 Tax=Parthenolecanium corni TaxID=536013 RepID=A0AAN9TGY7_9HEMI
MACMKLNKLEQYLQDIETFDCPKIKLEQYMTPPHIAACMLHTIQSSFEDIEDKMVADLGCGSGMLLTGSLLMDAAFCSGFDIDPGALRICAKNVSEFEFTSYDLLACDITMLDEKFYNLYDTVVMNPPFGTSSKGMDVEFLKSAMNISSGSVYSLHKSSTRDYITSKARQWHVKNQVIAELRFNLPHSYSFHKKKTVDIAVDLHRFTHT